MNEESSSLPTAVPTPIKKISVPSYSSSINGSMYSQPYYQQSSGAVNNNNCGSESNLSRSYISGGGGGYGSGGNSNGNQQPPYVNNNGASNSNVSERHVEYSMRKQLLRRLWSKDVKTISRPSSLSPPSRRTTPRRVNLDSTAAPSTPVDPTAAANLHPCEECQRLGVHRENNNNGLDLKRLRLTPGRSLDSSIIKPKPSPLASESSNSSPPTAASAEHKAAVAEAESEHQKRNDQQIRKSVLIYMTSLDKTTVVTESTINGNNPDTKNLANEKSEESVDSGNGEATQNLDNLTSSSNSDTDTSNRLNNNHQEEQPKEGTTSQKMSQQESQDSDELVSQLLINNMEQNGVTEYEVEATQNQPTYDTENNIINTATTTRSDDQENGNAPIEEIQYNELVRTDAIFDSQSTANSYRILSQSSDGHIQDVIVHEGTMSYFPSYSLVESRGDLSSYTSQCSEPDPEPLSAVTSGSAYPDIDFPYQVVVTRLSAVPRTMSMEVQPSSTSAEEEIEPDYDSGDDDTVSLVDSLDDPLSPRPQRRKGPRKSAEAFFVPIADASVDDEHLVVSDAMPDKLKERLDSRQKRRDQKKAHEPKVKLRAVRVERKISDSSERISRKENVPLNRGRSKPPRDSSTSSAGE